MTRRGQSGGLLSISSFLRGEDREQVRAFSLRVASVREAASKEGLQSLYADPAETLKKYKDFNIAEVMADYKGQKLLWVRARAIDADVVNANGDYFSEEELLAEVEIKGEKIPAYKTFEGVPIYTNHKNDDIEEAKGKVVYAEWDADEKCVWTTFYIDEEAYPHIVRGIRMNYMSDVSMGCSVSSGTCSECGNVAQIEKEYCDCLKKFKGKKNDKGKKVYEKNHGIKFIELSVVGDGAFDTCAIEEIYDVDEILDHARSLDKKAEAIRASVMIAATVIPQDAAVRAAYNDCLRQITSTTNQAVRLAQTAGTLVGGQLMAGDGANQNATVSNILQFLGIDARAGLNVLDMLNLALNFLEVAVMNLFARKDNVDLSHVAKITKSMGDLQATMQDMIDDGVDTSGGGNKPLNQGNLGGQGQGGGGMQPGPHQSQQDYGPAGNVGRAIGPQAGAPPGGGGGGGMPTQPQAFMMPPMGMGGGAFASTGKSVLVWADRNPDAPREVYASRTSEVSKSGQPPSILKFGESLLGLADALGLPAPGTKMNTRAAENTVSNKRRDDHPTPRVDNTGGTLMDIFKRFANQYRTKKAAMVTVDFNVDDETGNRITLSSDGTVKAYRDGERVAWNPILTDEQIVALENDNGGDVADQLLRSFAANDHRSKRAAEWTPVTDDDVKEHMLEEKRKGTDDKVKEKMLEDPKAEEYQRKGTDKDVREVILEPKRTGTDDDVKEHLLEGGLYGRRGTDDDVKEHLLEDIRLGNPDEVIENQLEDVRDNYGPGTPNLVVSSTMEALGTAVVTARVTPDEIIEAARKLSEREDLAELIHLASRGSKRRERIAARREFHRVQGVELAAESAVLHSLGKAVNQEVFAADLAEAIRVAANDESKSLQRVTKFAREKMGDSTDLHPAAVRKTISRADHLRAALATQVENVEDTAVGREHLKAALFAFAMAADELDATPSEVVSAFNVVEPEALLAEVELARTAAATDARLTQRERTEFWGKARVASKKDVYEHVVGWMADYADTYSYSSRLIVEAAKKLASTPKVAVKLVKQMVKAAGREAAVQVTDEQSSVKRIICRTEDLGGLDAKSPDFQDQFRTKAVEILASNGYQVDPGTFSLTNLTVSENGDITAEVSTRFSKTFSAESNGSGTVNSLPVASADGMGGGEPPVPPTPEEASQPETIMTAAAREYRKSRREAILNKMTQRVAQMPGMGGAGGMGGAMADPTAGAGMGADPNGLGMSSLTVPTAAGAEPEGAEEAGEDAAPGEKKPWGTVCPQCGSNDVELANGEGNCKNCNAQLQYKFSVEVLLKNI